MSEADEVAAGREAWAKVNVATSFEAWKVIATAVAVGRRLALRTAGVNRPYGAKYARFFNAWLDANGFTEMPYGLRAACCRLADDLTKIEQWRSGLSDAERTAQNHPEVIVRNFRKSLMPERQRLLIRRPNVKGPAKPIYWPQDAVRRAADAMRESRAGDWTVLARVALEAAIRGEDDLADLLESKPKRTSQKAWAEVAA